VSYQSDDDAIRAIRAELDRLDACKPRGLAKTDPRERHRRAAHQAFRAAVDSLLVDGWSFHRIANVIDCDVATLTTWYHYGDQKRNQVPAWAFAALPKSSRPQLVRAILDWSEPPPASKTGTENR
jgi:hypothetical protein